MLNICMMVKDFSLKLREFSLTYRVKVMTYIKHIFLWLYACLDVEWNWHRHEIKVDKEPYIATLLQNSTMTLG